MKNLVYFKILISLILIVSCSKEGVVPEPILESSNIILNFDNLEVLNEKNILITFEDEVTIDSVTVSVDGAIEGTLYKPPYAYDFDGTKYSDGEHVFKVDVYQKNQSSIKKSVKFRTDNNGPVISDFDVNSNQVICGDIIINPTIKDAVTNVKNVELLINDISVSKVQGSSNHIFKIEPDLYLAGQTELKFIMEDEVGNVSSESITILMGNPVVKINLPNEFTRASVEKLLIMLSDAEGNYIDSKWYGNQEETLEFCSDIINPDAEYMLTFFEIFDNSIYNVFCYGNLSKNKIGNEITLKPRPLTNSYASIELSTKDLNLSESTRASGQGYSMVTINNVLNGTLTTSYANNLGSSKTLINSYNSLSIDSEYKWAFIDHLENVSALQPSDFSDDNVVADFINFNSLYSNRSLRLYGFENTELMDVFSGHDLYHSKMPYSYLQGCKYYFPDIFSNYFYSVVSNNYYKEGLGLPPQSIDIPNLSVDFSLIGNQLNFQGIPNYEVGKIRIKNETQPGVNISITNPSVIIDFIFDGGVDKVVIPKLPPDLLEENIYVLFNNANFSPIQVIAENYSSFYSYQEYLQNVFINSAPFYLNSSSRERVFKSLVSSSQVQPVYEYPYFTRF